jgi:SAM-dependent methyltransferase
LSNRYTEIHYNEALRPYTGYPVKLCNHLADQYFGRRDGKLLDLCCGRGEHMGIFNDIGFETYGIDRENVGQERGLNVSIADVEKDPFPFDDNFFDSVMMKSAIEHIANTGHLLQEIHRVMKPGANVVITTCDWKKLYKIFYDDFTHVSPFTRASLQDAMRMFKFKEVVVEHFYHLPFTWKGGIRYHLPKLIGLVPVWYSQTSEMTELRKLIRFSKEVQLLAFATK